VDLEIFCTPRLGPAVVPEGLAQNEKVVWIDQQRDYLYAGARKSAFSSAENVLVYENPAAMDHGINILFSDGSVEFREMRWAIETLARCGAIV
jgi:prepilin-type processing-associated H-X9-DG protein